MITNMTARATVRGLAILLLAVPSIHAQGWIVPRPCVSPTDVPRPCPIAATSIVRTRNDVHVTLGDRVLRWEVEERFVNRGGGLGEADYIFPLPTGAAFQDLQLSIDGQMVAGETMNADEARRIYEDIVRRQRDPALVEWMGHGLLRARIFPLPPGEEKRVVVRFTSVIEREGDAMRVDYARGSEVGNRGSLRAADSRSAIPESFAPTFTLSYPSSAAYGRPYSPTHELDVHDGDGTRTVQARGTGDVTVLLPIRRGNAASIASLAYAPGGEDGYTLITVAPPVQTARTPMPREVTFVLDVSGSMSGAKMEQARAAGRMLLGTLHQTDRFRLIDFATDVRTFRDSAVAATEDNLREARRYLDALEASGSTNIAGALDAALRDQRDDDGRLHVVLFVTDGEPTVGERQPDALARLASSERHGARLFTFGLGADVNTTLLERLALEGGGTAQFVRPEESVERTVGLVANRIAEPVLTDVSVKVEGNGLRLEKMHPAQSLDLFAGQDLVVLARYRGHGSGRIVVEGKRRGETVRWDAPVTMPERERDNAFVARLWAVQRIGYLSAERHEHGPNPELDNELRTLGERFGIPTELTSYLVREPQVAMRDRTMNAPMPLSRGAAGGAAGVAAPAPSRDARFDEAKVASEQRATRSIAAMDSVSVAYAGASARRTVDARTFELRDGRWTDVSWRDGMRTLKVKAFSSAYFALLQRLPELTRPLALGDRVLVAGVRVAVDVGDEGATELSSGELDRLMSDWR